jgi:hypothetical protein
MDESTTVLTSHALPFIAARRDERGEPTVSHHAAVAVPQSRYEVILRLPGVGCAAVVGTREESLTRTRRPARPSGAPGFRAVIRKSVPLGNRAVLVLITWKGPVPCVLTRTVFSPAP